MFRRRDVATAGTPLALALALVLLAGCGPNDDWKVSLSPYPNHFGPDHPMYAPQPHRDHPLSLALSADGAKLYVTLQGFEDEPGHEIAVVDTAGERVLRRIEVGSSPTGIELHPGGRFLVVTNRFSNWASVVDTVDDEVVLDIPVPFYTTEIVFSPDGQRAWLTNRWKDSVLRWDLDVDADRFRVTGDDYSSIPLDLPMGIPVGQNPRDLALSADGSRLFVASVTGVSLSVIDTASEVELRRVNLNSPVADVAVAGAYVYVTHIGSGSQHRPDEGRDTNGDGLPGDGTANVMFQDLQNEIEVFDFGLDRVVDYTSDSICCKDFRDVDPDLPDRGLSLHPPDTWPPSRAGYLPPRERWIVACALPEQMALRETTLMVVCSGSNEVQTFDVGPGGDLTPREVAGGLYRTGMNPYDAVFTADGRKAYVAERLGEHVTVLDLDKGPTAPLRRILVGDVSGGEFPATDAEIGEAINFVTAPFTVDGDQVCAACHREGDNIAKLAAMPLQGSAPVVPGLGFTWGTRFPPAYRGAFDTRPWFFETAMDETNFFPVLNEFNRKENFCCEQLDYLVWDLYPTADACLADTTLEGCNHVLDCSNDPPPECDLRPYGSPFLARNEAFLDAAVRLFGVDHTFGDGLYVERPGPGGELVREGIPIDFNGATRALGLFLLANPRFLPNPNASLDLPAARRGRVIYESPSVGCNNCHPLPLTTVSNDFNPFGVPLRFPAVITPRLGPGGENVDVITDGFLQTFPDAEQDAAGIRFGVPQLRGIWDRANLFFHDARARGLREALATPGHPALLPGEIGRNETFGMRDTHGATSGLTAGEMEDLIAFLLTL
jgi:DNA-binding beta-propeller fold protein YncE